MEKLFENKKLNVSIRTVRRGEEVLLYAKDMAESLGYMKPRNVVGAHVWNENKVILDAPRTRPELGRQWNFKPNTIFLTEPGVYQLIFKSNIPSASEFQRWMFKEVLPSIRKTGSYGLPEPKPLNGNQLKLINETDLHYAVIRHIRKYHTDALVIPGLGRRGWVTIPACIAVRHILLHIIDFSAVHVIVR